MRGDNDGRGQSVSKNIWGIIVGTGQTLRGCVKLYPNIVCIGLLYSHI